MPSEVVIYVLVYLARRLAQTVLTIFGVLTVVFFLVRITGDPAALLVPPDAPPEAAERIRHALGLDRPLNVQYATFLMGAVQGDLGVSIRQGVPALELVLERLPATLVLAVTSFLLGIILAFALGLVGELSGSRRVRNFVLWVAVARQSVPIFLFGLLLILVFSVALGLLPSLGSGSPLHLILPALALATYQLALYVRLFNSAFAEQAETDYVRTTYAKGATRARAVLAHMLPNALLPIVTIAGINFGVLLSGTVITETVFSWPGVGRLIVQAVHQRDYPVVQAGIVVISSVFVLVNLFVDLLYTVLDPRVRFS